MPTIYERMEARRNTFIKQAEKKFDEKYSYFKRMYQKTKDKKWVWMAYKLGADVDYIPGYDDGEFTKN